jgi:hypothetical protein
MGPKIGGDAMGMQPRSWWQKIQQHWVVIVVVAMALVLFSQGL